MRRQNKILLGVAKTERANRTAYRGRAYINGKYVSGPYRNTPEEAHADYLELRSKFPYRNRGPNNHPAGLSKLSQEESDAVSKTEVVVRIAKDKSQPNQALKGTPFYGL